MKNVKKVIADLHLYLSTNTITISIVVFLLLLVGLVVTVDQATRQQDSRSQAAALKNCTVSDNQVNLDAEEKKLMQLINAYRKEKNIPTLKTDSTLIRSAAWMSNDMAVKNYFSHKDSANRLQGKRVIDCGYPAKENQIRENIVAGTSLNTAQAVFNAWKKSKIHNETMLDKTMFAMGVGRKQNTASKLGSYWVLDVAQKGEKESNPPPNEEEEDNDDCIAEDLQVETESAGANSGTTGNTKNNKNTNNNVKNKNKQNTKKKNAKKKNTKKKNNKKNNTNKNGTEKGNPTPEQTSDCPEEPEDEDGNENEEENENEENTPSPTPRPNTSGVFFDVTFPGIGGSGNADPVHTTKSLSIQMLNASGSAVINKTVDAEFDGNVFYAFINASELQSGSYQIRAKLPNTLRKILLPEFQTIDKTKQATIPVSHLVVGDFDNNNILNIADFNIFRACVDTGFLNDEEEIVEDEDEFFDDEELIDEEELEEEEELDDEDLNDEEFEEELEEEEDVETESITTRIQAAACSQHDATDINDDGIVDMIDYNFLLEGFSILRGN